MQIKKKEKINKILEISMTNINISDLNKLEYHYKNVDDIFEYENKKRAK